jgi:hypothetical protein
LIKAIENIIIDLQDVDSSVHATVGPAVRFEEKVRIAEQDPGEHFRVGVPAAEIGAVEMEGLEVRGGREGHEGAVVEGLFVPACAEAHEVDGLKTLLIARTDDCEEAVEGIGIEELEVLAVQDVDGFVVDLFADGEEVRDERVQSGLFVWFLTPLRFPTPCCRSSVSPAISVVFIIDENSTDCSSVRFGFRRNSNAVIFGKGHLIDHVAKLWRQFHEWEWLLGFLTRVGVLRFLFLWCLFRRFLGRSVSNELDGWYLDGAEGYLVLAVCAIVVVAFIMAVFIV